MTDLSVERYKKLKERQDILLKKVHEANGLVAAKKAELRKIFDKYKVSSVDELKAQFSKKEQQAEKLLSDAERFIGETSAKLSELDRKLASID
jgi:cell division septum initiation protein DivIVA